MTTVIYLLVLCEMESRSRNVSFVSNPMTDVKLPPFIMSVCKVAKDPEIVTLKMVSQYDLMLNLSNQVTRLTNINRIVLRVAKNLNLT